MNTELKQDVNDIGKELQMCGFKIDKGLYAVPVLRVQEVLNTVPTTPVPLAPDYIDGLINLRGKIILAINIRKILGVDGEDLGKRMGLIVNSEDSIYSMGVDDVLDTFMIDEKLIKRPPETIDQKIRMFADGVYSMDKKLIILLNLDRILSLHECQGS